MESRRQNLGNMSNRAIKRYEEALKAKERQEGAPQDEETVSSEESPIETKAGPRNPFELLAEDGEGSNEDDDNGEEESLSQQVSREKVAFKNTSKKLSTRPKGRRKFMQGSGSKNTSTHSTYLHGEEGKASDLEKKRAKKKRAKKRKRRGKKDDTETEMSEEFKQQVEEVMMDIEKLAFGSSGRGDTMVCDLPLPRMGKQDIAKKLTASKVIAPDIRFLNPDSELKRLFGARIIENERRAEDAAVARQWQRHRVRGRGQATRRPRKKTILVTPRETWSDHAPGLSMKLDGSCPEAQALSVPGVKHFRYTQEKPYLLAQAEYRHRIASHDPNQLAQLLSQFPYHVDSLLQLSELHRQMGELERSAEFVERALYILESHWTAAFAPQTGLCRLSYQLPENRSLYVALLRHSQLLTRRGLHQTSLEVLKMLLCFDPEKDPMGVLLMIDSAALTSGEEGWLISKFLPQFTFVPLRLFPNFAVSAALGKFIRARKRNDSNGRDEAEGELVNALLAFPMVLRPLIAAVEDDQVGWMKYSLYDEEEMIRGVDDGGVLNRISRIYAEKAKPLWKDGGNMALLRLCSVKAGEIHLRGDREAEKGREIRKEAGEFMKSSKLYKGVTISDYLDQMTQLPAELLAEEEIGARETREVGGGEAVAEFLRSILPWSEGNGTNSQGVNLSDGNNTQMIQNVLDIGRRLFGNNTRNNEDGADQDRGDEAT